MKYLIVGLGNIGGEYELTRHNIGFLAVDQLADKFQVAFTVTRLAEKCEFRFKGKNIHVIKPTTFMNLSGKAVQYWMNELKIPKENILVIVDDVAIPFGHVRLRSKGSSAGHNGLKNIELLLSTQEYPRLRIGIGGNYSKGQQVNYVLGRFTEEEFEKIPIILEKAVEMSLSFCTMGVEKTMSAFND